MRSGRPWLIRCAKSILWGNTIINQRKRKQKQTQDEKSSIRKLKHGGNRWLRCGNTAANACFRWRIHYGFSCFRRCVFNGTGTLFLHVQFPTDFCCRNHVFPQSLTCVYVAETRYSVPETCYFLLSTSGNVKIRSCNLTCFSVFPSFSVTA